VAVCWPSWLTNGAFSQAATATNLTDSQQNSISVVKMLELAAGALSLVARHVENHPEPGVAGHHALVGFRGVLERQHFDHGRDCMRGAEG
jgi:hypothetical protein